MLRELLTCAFTDVVIILYIDNTLFKSLKLTQRAILVFNLRDFQDHLHDRDGMAAQVLFTNLVCANEIAVLLNTSGEIELTKVVSCLSLARNKGRSLARKTFLSGSTQ